MNKPFSIICEEFKQELANLINNSGLPPCMLTSVLQNYLYEVGEVAKNQYRTDKIQYEKSLSEKEDSHNEPNINGN